MKLYTTRLTFPDIQRSEYTPPSTPTPDAQMDFPDIDTSRHNASDPVDHDRKGERAYYAHRLGYRPAPVEVVSKIPQYERGDLP